MGIQLVLAQSPQAKGRVERLWGTLQSRLVSELRLAGAATLEEANRVLLGFLERFNARFRVAPAVAGSAYRALEGVDLDATLCFHYYRKVAKDNTVVWRDQTLQLAPGRDRSSYAKAVVEVQERLNGQVVILYKGLPLGSHDAPHGAGKLRSLWDRGLDLKDQLGAQVGLPRTRSRKVERERQGMGSTGQNLGSEHRHVPLAKSKAHTPPPDHPWRKKTLT